MIGGYVDLFDVVESKKAITNTIKPSINMTSLNSDAIFAAIKEKVDADPAKAKSVNGVFLYKITRDGKVVKEWSELNLQVSLRGLCPTESPKVANYFLCVLQKFN